LIEAFVLTPQEKPRWRQPLKHLFDDFFPKATTHYEWHDEPIPFDVMETAIAQGIIQAVMAWDAVTQEPLAFMLFSLESHRAIEITLVHMPALLASEDDITSWKTTFDALMTAFLAHIVTLPGWDCVSYALLGVQERLVLMTPWYGLKPVGQTIQVFDFTNQLALPLLAKQQHVLPPLTGGVRTRAWQPSDRKQMPQLIAKAFRKQSDALWDPRFRSPEGVEQVLRLFDEGVMGKHLTQCTTMLTDGEGMFEMPIGFCFFLNSQFSKANIPLIGIDPDFQRQGLGKQLLCASMVRLVEEVRAGRLLVQTVDATVDTENVRALNMYRRIGFQETHTYPHAYLNRDTLAKSYYGKRFAKDMVPGA